MKQPINITLMLLLLLGSCSKPPAKVRPPPPVTITPVIQKDVPLYIEAPGHIEAYNTVELKSQVTGVITGVYYDQGTLVKEGDLLVTIDKRPFEAKLHEAEAQVARNVASLRYARDTANRNTPLVQEDYISQDSYENLVTNVLVDEATVKESSAQRDLAEVNLSYCTITAPMDSVTGERLVDEGNLVVESGQTNIVVLNQIHPIYCSFAISERYFSQVQKRMEEGPVPTVVSYTRDFEESWTGAVEFMDNAVDQTTGMIKFKSTFPNQDNRLWPGIFVYTRLILEEKKGALLVPAGAIVMSQKGKFLFVMKSDDTVEQRYVTVGQQEGEFVIIEKGVNPGEKVVLEGQQNLVTGKKVTVKGEKTVTNESI